MERHIRRESQNYQVPCYVLKMDISGYFMHIDRRRLLDITLRQLRRMASHRAYGDDRWFSRLDFDFVEWLTATIILQDPTESCRRRGSLLDWQNLPHDKSLFHSPPGSGLPIGNLTSQLFSNVYLNELDQYAKRTLRCRHYGRYVDDFYVVSADREWLLSLQVPLVQFLHESLGLSVNQGKTCLCDVRRGVGFLGAYLKPRRRYASNATYARMKVKVAKLKKCDSPFMLRNSLNSFLGLLSHYKSYRLRQDIVHTLNHVYSFGYYQRGLRKVILFPLCILELFKYTMPRLARND